MEPTRRCLVSTGDVARVIAWARTSMAYDPSDPNDKLLEAAITRLEEATGGQKYKGPRSHRDG